MTNWFLLKLQNRINSKYTSCILYDSLFWVKRANWSINRESTRRAATTAAFVIYTSVRVRRAVFKCVGSGYDKQWTRVAQTVREGGRGVGNVLVL